MPSFEGICPSNNCLSRFKRKSQKSFLVNIKSSTKLHSEDLTKRSDHEGLCQTGDTFKQDVTARDKSDEELVGDRPYENLDDYISQDDLRALSDRYKQIAGFAGESLGAK